MNQFLEQFEKRINDFWEIMSDEERNKLLADILDYANSNPQSFKKDFMEIRFDKNLTAMPIVLEALAKDTANWGNFYIELLIDIFEKAKTSKNPKEILSNLMEFAYIENDENTFIQNIVEKIYKETECNNVAIKLSAIDMLPPYLKNPAVKNTSSMISSLQQKLFDKNWKVRYVTYNALKYENLLPDTFNLSPLDKLRKLILGQPL